MAEIDWEAAVRQYHALGLWHAMRHLATVSTVKDPAETARDVVQAVWVRLWREQKFSKAMFVTDVHRGCIDAIRASQPIELRRGSGRHNTRPLKGGKFSKRSRVTDTFPVQVFGCYIDEVIMEDEVRGFDCGDE